MKGYKAFDKNLKCRGFQYEIGETYEMSEEPEICRTGFHFCKTIGDCYFFYPMDKTTRICEVEAIGDIISEGTKYCTNKIRIVREVEDCKRGGNISSDNNGYMNVGQKNKGNLNTGSLNIGDLNTGYCNTGDSNTGNSNTGYSNTGYRNTGDRNVGDRNVGDRNVGNWNAGNWNTGYNNLGYYNSGDWNTGNGNSGDWNTGDGNSGDWNSTSWTSGCFNTEAQKITMFDKPTDWTMDDWRKSKAYRTLTNSPLVIDVKKKKIKTNAVQNWWNKLPERQRVEIFDLPNFDAEKFEKCTGIRVNIG